MRVRLSGDQRSRLVRIATPSTEAHSLYLQGLYLWNRRTYRNIKQASSFFERAIAIDPRYAQAHAGLAMTYAILPTYADIDNGEAFANAERIATGIVERHSTPALAEGR
jgi:Tfp pilus assembly protein PilF